MRRDDPRFLPYVGLISAMVLWASSFVALKVAFTAYDPMYVIFGPMFVAALCLFPALRRTDHVRYRKGDWKYLLFMGFCEPCLYYIFESQALMRTSASQAGMIVAMLPLMTAVAAHFALKEKVGRRAMAGFALAIVGAVWLSAAAEQTEHAPAPVLGNVLEFVAMACATGYMVTMKHLSVRYSPVFITALQATMGSVFYLPLLALPTTAQPQGFAMLPFLAILYLGTFVTIGGYGLYNYGTSKIPVNQSTAFTNLIPVITLFLGWLLLGETFTAQQYAASALVLAGVFLSQERHPLEEVREERGEPAPHDRA